MSLSTLFYLAVCYGTYKLGAFKERYPGRLVAWSRYAVLWAWKFLNN